jgi:hypothetical protein
MRKMIIFMIINTFLFINSAVSNNDYLDKYLSESLNDKHYNAIKQMSAIPDEETAKQIAYIYACKIYSKKTIDSELPFKVVLYKGYWFISGTLKKGYEGGVIEMIIEQKTGKVINITHGK